MQNYTDRPQLKGLKVLGLDQFELGHRFGSSHGQSRIIRKAYFECADYVPLLQRSYELWKTLESETNKDVWMANSLVITAGASSSEMLKSLKLPLKVFKKTMFWFKPEDDYEFRRLPCYLHEMPYGLFYGFPRINDTGVSLLDIFLDEFQGLPHSARIAFFRGMNDQNTPVQNVQALEREIATQEGFKDVRDRFSFRYYTAGHDLNSSAASDLASIFDSEILNP